MTEPFWLPIDVVIDTNKDVVAATGETFFLRDRGLLESALGRPKNHFHYGQEDVLVLATSLLFGIAQNHPFEQGNKRTALLSALQFLRLNGCMLLMPDTDQLGKLIVSVMERTMTEDAFVSVIRTSIVTLT